MNAARTSRQSLDMHNGVVIRRWPIVRRATTAWAHMHRRDQAGIRQRQKTIFAADAIQQIRANWPCGAKTILVLQFLTDGGGRRTPFPGKCVAMAVPSCALAATMEKNCGRQHRASIKRPQIVVEVDGPDLRGRRGMGLRSGPRSLGDESGLESITPLATAIINTLRECVRHMADMSSPPQKRSAAVSS